MRQEFLSYLSCPISSGSLQLEGFASEGDQVIDGLLVGKTSSAWYPIIAGVPRMLVGSLREETLRRHHDFYLKYKARLPKSVREEWQRTVLSHSKSLLKFDAHQRETADSFAYEWENIYEDNDFEKNNFLHFVSPYLKEKDFLGKVVIDAGCGSGRFTKQVAEMKAELVVGSDLGESAVIAFERTKHLTNVLIVQADIYQMPILERADITMSIGVLHHLPEPEKGFCSLKKTLKKSGQLIIWVYNRRNNARAIYLYEPLRRLTSKLPKKLLLKLCYLPALIVHLINLCGLGFKRIGLENITKRLPFAYYANFPFSMKLNDAFDVLATPKSNYYLSEEVEGWYNRCGIRGVRSFEHKEAGITLIGQK